MPAVDKENMGGAMRIDYSNKLDKKWARHEINRTIHWFAKYVLYASREQRSEIICSYSYKLYDTKMSIDQSRIRNSDKK